MTTIREIARTLTTVPADASFEGQDATGSFQATAASIKAGAFAGCLLRRLTDLTADLTLISYVIPWDGEAYDLGGWHSTSSNLSRITVPAEFNGRYAQFGANLRFTGNASGNSCMGLLWKNGSADFIGNAANANDTTFATPSVSFMSPPILLATGDYFEVQGYSESDTSLTLIAARSSFWCQVL
jgi:hypothetical protein